MKTRFSEEGANLGSSSLKTPLEDISKPKPVSGPFTVSYGNPSRLSTEDSPCELTPVSTTAPAQGTEGRSFSAMKTPGVQAPEF